MASDKDNPEPDPASADSGDSDSPNPSPESEAAVEELLRSLEQELKESGNFPSEAEAAALAEADAASEAHAEDEELPAGTDDADEPDPGSGPEVVFGVSGDIDPREMFAELSEMFGQLAQGSSPFDALFDSYEPALQLAVKIATDDQPEPTVEPTSRMRLEELFKLAHMRVRTTTGFSLNLSSDKPDIVTREEWVTNLLKDVWPAVSADSQQDEEVSLVDPLAMVQNIMFKLSSAARLMQMGGMLGELSHTAFGYYVLPVPTPTGKQPRPVAVIAVNVEEFAQEWELDYDQAALWVCLTEILSQAILLQPDVRRTLWRLYESFIAELDDATADEWEEKLREFEHSAAADPADMLQSLFGDAGEVAIRFSESDEQLELAQQISAIATVVVSVVQYLAEKIITDMVGTGGNLVEAFRRQLIKTAETSNFGRQVLGISLDLDQGMEFVKELDEHQGADVLQKLWSSEAALPTPAELAAPRLWLARMDLL